MLSYPHDLTSGGKGDDGGLCLVSTSTIVFRFLLVMIKIDLHGFVSISTWSYSNVVITVVVVFPAASLHLL